MEETSEARIARINREAEAETFNPGQIVTAGQYGGPLAVHEVKGGTVYCLDPHSGKIEGHSPYSLKNYGQGGPKRRR